MLVLLVKFPTLLFDKASAGLSINIDAHEKRSIEKGYLKKRLEFVRKIKRVYKNGSMFLWNKQISMYIDAVGYEYKSNPFEHSKTPAAREWRLKNEVLLIGCTTKGKKEGATQVKFMVGIS